MRQRKTVDVWNVYGNYGAGWECVTAEASRREALRRLREYRENEPQYAHKLVMRREPIQHEPAAQSA